MDERSPSTGHPLLLSAPMRTRLRSAVHALLAHPTLAQLTDVGRLAAVVLYAKSRAPRGRSDDNRTTIRGTELGRRLGVTPSTVHHTVLPSLRATGALHTRVISDARGRTTGLECTVVPLVRAREAGAAEAMLSLSQVELSVLLRLREALFGPGWKHRDGSVTPAGLLAHRTGRGAATDRLGLLLILLSTNSRGWLQLCPGVVDTGRGRPAVTVARLLGCTPAAGAKVLSRLQSHRLVEVVRRQTSFGLRATSRVRLTVLTAAHRADAPHPLDAPPPPTPPSVDRSALQVGKPCRGRRRTYGCLAVPPASAHR
ncbi:hypothetical protein ACWFR5_43105 [Streptomyces sp. NPDC055092]